MLTVNNFKLNYNSKNICPLSFRLPRVNQTSTNRCLRQPQVAHLLHFNLFSVQRKQSLCRNFIPFSIGDLYLTYGRQQYTNILVQVIIDTDKKKVKKSIYFELFNCIHKIVYFLHKSLIFFQFPQQVICTLFMWFIIKLGVEVAVPRTANPIQLFIHHLTRLMNGKKQDY